MNFAYPSRLHLRFALNLAGRSEGEGGRETPPVEPEPSRSIIFNPQILPKTLFSYAWLRSRFSSWAMISLRLMTLWEVG